MKLYRIHGSTVYIFDARHHHMASLRKAYVITNPPYGAEKPTLLH